MNWPDDRLISSSRFSTEGHLRGIYARRRCVALISANLSPRKSRMSLSGMYGSSSATRVDNSHNKPALNAREMCCSGRLEKRKMSGRWRRCSAVAKTSKILRWDMGSAHSSSPSIITSRLEVE